MPLTTRPRWPYRRSRVAVRLVGSLEGEDVPLALPDGAVVEVHEGVGPAVPLVVDELDVVLVVEVLEVADGSLAHVVLVGLDVVEVDVDGSLVVLVDEVGEDVGDALVLVELDEDVGVPVVLVEVEVVLVPGREVVDVVGRDVVVLVVGWLVSAAGIPGVSTVLHGWCGDPGVTVEVLSRTDCVPSR